MENTLLMGYAKQALTPKRDVYLGGYIDEDGAQNLCRYPQDILGDVYVTAVCLEQDGTRAVLVCIDNCLNIDGESTPAGLFQSIADTAGTTVSNVFVTNTHNHQSFKYLQQPEAEIILQTVRRAAEDLHTVTMQYKQLHADVGVNRRPKYVVAPHLPYDNSLSVLRLRSEGRKDLLILNYQMHNTALGVGRMENAHLMCGELMGAAVAQLEQELDCTVYFANGFYGAAGPNIDGHFSADYPRILEVGQQLGKTVAASLEPMQMLTPGKLQTYRVQHTLPVNQVYGPEAQEQLDIRVVSLGEIGILGVDCEPFSEIGAWLKAYSPFSYTVLLGNVSGFTGYIPTDEAFDAGSEERECRLNKTPYTKGISRLFRDHCLQALCDAVGRDVEEAFCVSLQHVGGGIYKAEAEESYVNRLVLDFGFLSRDNCPADFILQAGTVLQTVWDNSVNFMSVSMKLQPVSQISLQVTKTYQNVSGIDQLDIKVHGLAIRSREKE